MAIYIRAYSFMLQYLHGIYQSAYAIFNAALGPKCFSVRLGFGKISFRRCVGDSDLMEEEPAYMALRYDVKRSYDSLNSRALSMVAYELQRYYWDKIMDEIKSNVLQDVETYKKSGEEYAKNMRQKMGMDGGVFGCHIPLDADKVNHPKHYNSHPSGIECIQVTEYMGFNLGNAVKYIWRADLKGDRLEDLKKAEFYVKREIQRIQNLE